MVPLDPTGILSANWGPISEREVFCVDIHLLAGSFSAEPDDVMWSANRSSQAHFLIRTPMQLVSVSGMGDKVKVMLSVVQDNTQAPKTGMPWPPSQAL